MTNNNQQPKRKRGGQKGNQNARTHGRYSRVIPPRTLEVLKAVRGLDLNGQRLIFAQLFRHLVGIKYASRLESHSSRAVPEKVETDALEADFNREFDAWAKERNLDDEDFTLVE